MSCPKITYFTVTLDVMWHYVMSLGRWSEVLHCCSLTSNNSRHLTSDVLSRVSAKRQTAPCAGRSVPSPLCEGMSVIVCLLLLLLLLLILYAHYSTCKISDKSDKFLLNFSNLFWGPLFSRAQRSVYLMCMTCLVYLRTVAVDNW